MLDVLSNALDRGDLTYHELPLIFCRVRSQEQFIRFAKQLTKHHVKALTGINFPKFNVHNGNVYMFYLKQLNEKFGEIIYGMPIIEDQEVAFRETRMTELIGIRDILDKYKRYRAADTCRSYRFFVLFWCAKRCRLFNL